MGNNLRGVGLLSNIGDCPFRLQLGRHATIELSEREDEKRDDGGLSQRWTMSYNVDGPSFFLDKLNLLREYKGYSTIKKKQSYELQLERRGIGHGRDILFFNFHDDKCPLCFQLKIQRDDKTHLLEVEKKNLCSCGKGCIVKCSRSTNAWGVVTDTWVFFYGYESINAKGSLIVVETKSKSKEKRPYAATVVHYYVKGGGNDFFKTYKTDIGLSTVAKIGLSNINGELEFTVEGPVQHPAASLLHMFDQVRRSGTWKPTSCPHCADSMKQRRSLLLQSDSEDNSNGFQPPARHNGCGQNARRHLANNGNSFEGNGNGNFFEGNNNVFL